ncbi:MAG: signal peptidase II [Actinomycetaceae bacterium]|nr:signal peptidase II [Actinomycetaceae bacterium]
MAFSLGKRLWFDLVFVLVALVAVVSDQVTKAWALRNVSENQIEPFLGNFISFQLVHNSGAAFSLLANATWVFTILAVVIIGVMLVYIHRTTSLLWLLSLSLLFGGAFGNLLDRLFRPPSFGTGHVVDFLNWNGWFVGNVADIYIVVAAVALFLLAMLGVPLKDEPEQVSADE